MHLWQEMQKNNNVQAMKNWKCLFHLQVYYFSAYFSLQFSTLGECFTKVWIRVTISYWIGASKNNLLFDFLKGSSLNSRILVSTKLDFSCELDFFALPGPRPLSCCFLLEETTRLLARSEALGNLNPVKAFLTASDGCELVVKSTASASSVASAMMTDQNKSEAELSSLA